MRAPLIKHPRRFNVLLSNVDDLEYFWMIPPNSDVAIENRLTICAHSSFRGDGFKQTSGKQRPLTGNKVSHLKEPETLSEQIKITALTQS